MKIESVGLEDKTRNLGALKNFLRAASGGMLFIFFISCCAAMSYYAPRAAAARAEPATRAEFAGQAELAAQAVRGGAEARDELATRDELAARAVSAARAPAVKVTEEFKVIDDAGVYARDGYGDDCSIVYLYMTVRRGNGAENSDTPWDELAKHSTIEYDALGTERDRVECILQEGGADGPAEGMFGHGASVPNGVVNIRGSSTSMERQKSYKVYLKEGWTWRGQQNINLNKHVYDKLRFRNKLMYDIIRDIPGMIGMRTQFVRLYVKDETGGAVYGGDGLSGFIDETEDANYGGDDLPGVMDEMEGADYGRDGLSGFVDYGLYTQIENPNKTYLRNHGLDPYGHLYKAREFEFRSYDDDIRLASDPEFNLKHFNAVIKSKGNGDHSKLRKMLDDLYRPDYPIGEFFDKYFDRENYFTWMAFNILTANTDTIDRNFLLYSPQNCDKWFFIAWDADGALARLEPSLIFGKAVSHKNDYGIQNYWPIYFHRRILADDAYRALLDDYVERLAPYFTREVLAPRAARYGAAIRGVLFGGADAGFLRLEDARGNIVAEYGDAYDVIADSLADEARLSYDLYKSSRDEIMNFYVDMPAKIDNGYHFKWNAAYVFKPARIRYEIQLATDIDFQDIIYQRTDISVLSVDAEGLYLPAGTYYYRVKAYDGEGRETLTSEYVEDRMFVIHRGVQAFSVDEAGDVL